MPGNICNIDDPFAGAFSDIHQIAAHLAARDRSAEDLVSDELSLKSWNQGMVYLVGKFNFCLDPKISTRFESNEVDESDIREDGGNDCPCPKSKQLVLVVADTLPPQIEALKDEMGGKLHALALRTGTPER